MISESNTIPQKLYHFLFRENYLLDAEVVTCVIMSNIALENSYLGGAYLKKAFKFGCFGLIGLFVLFVIIGIFASNGDSPATTAPSTPASNVTAEPQTNETQAEEPEETKLAGIGEELQVGDVVFKVNEISTTKEIKDGDFFSFKPNSDGSVFLIVNVTVKNVGKDAINTDSSFFLLEKGEIEYSPTTLITTSDKFFLYDGINPGLAKTGNVAFEIPEDMTEFVLNVQTGFWGTEQGKIQLY